MTVPINNNFGVIVGINGSIIKIRGLEKQARLHDLLKIVDKNIISEVIQIYSDSLIAQSFENTVNLRLNEKVINLGKPLSMELGPGLMNNVFDGIQRPLGLLFEQYADGTLKSGVEINSLSRHRKWYFTPLIPEEKKVVEGDIIGEIEETSLVMHRIMVPPSISGKISYMAEEGLYTIEEEIFRIKMNGGEHSFTLLQKWPITINRPFLQRLQPHEPLLTGTRYIDLLFPIAKGGTCAIPGGFGTGKSVLLQTIAKYCNADVIVYICCGEPGNEIANLIKQFKETLDPKTNRPISERAVVIANTSNMPVSAREASLFSGATIAEYYRDMGYDVAIFADSTSRWAESLREISSRLEEMPAEEGYPAYLFSRISSFYERAGAIQCLGKYPDQKERNGSITIISSLSPPGGDLNEPVTASTKRVVQEVLVLDSKLSYLKIYPSINWLSSYSGYVEHVSNWWKNKDIEWEEVSCDWKECREFFNEILSKEHELEDIRQILGVQEISKEVKLDLFTSKLIRSAILNQSAFNEIDCFTDARKLLGLIKLIKIFHETVKTALREQITKKMIDDRIYWGVLKQFERLAHDVPNENFHELELFKEKIKTIFKSDIEEWILQGI
ncbi:MAG: V-type ATP synthase subunit A [Promethearchaeota archaeon]